MKQKILKALSTINNVFGFIVVNALAIAIVIVVEGLLFMLAWNYCMPYVFALPAITLLQSVCMQIVTLLTFSSIVVALHNLKK